MARKLCTPTSTNREWTNLYICVYRYTNTPTHRHTHTHTARHSDSVCACPQGVYYYYGPWLCTWPGPRIDATRLHLLFDGASHAHHPALLFLFYLYSCLCLSFSPSRCHDQAVIALTFASKRTATADAAAVAAVTACQPLPAAAAAAAVATTVATADELTHRYKYSNQFKSNHHESHRIQLQLHAPMVGLNITSSVLWRAKSAQGLYELSTGFLALSDQTANCSLSFKLMLIFMEFLKRKIMSIVEGREFILCKILFMF